MRILGYGQSLIQYLQSKPYLRLGAMNPVNVLPFEVGSIHGLQVDGVIGIRSAVASGLGWSCVPAMSIQELLEEKKVHELKFSTMTTDDVSLWWLRSRKDVAVQSKVLANWISLFS